MNTEIKLDGQNFRDESPYVPKEESIYDSWLDLAGYAVLALIYISGWFDKD